MPRRSQWRTFDVDAIGRRTARVARINKSFLLIGPARVICYFVISQRMAFPLGLFLFGRRRFLLWLTGRHFVAATSDGALSGSRQDIQSAKKVQRSIKFEKIHKTRYNSVTRLNPLPNVIKLHSKTMLSP